MARQRWIKAESTKGPENYYNSKREIGRVVAAAIRGAMQFALVAVNTVCALSFIKPVWRVFNLKLLPRSTKSRHRHSPGNSLKLNHALEK